MKTVELQLDDLAPGVLCTVLDANAKSVQQEACDSPVAVIAAISGGKYERWVGHAMEIQAVDLPFVVVKPYRWDNAPGQPIDTREAKLVRISREFAEAQAPPKKPWWRFWK
jgi:hypothetical protein